MERFLLGLVAGAAACGITYLVHPAPPWWLLVGLVVAVLVWFRELWADLLIP
jgi:xanthosine utilization system XapX-like protein